MQRNNQIVNKNETNQIESTASIFQRLKNATNSLKQNLQVHNDGVGIKGVGNIRLSNIRHFPNNAIQNTSTLLRMSLLLSSFTLAKAEKILKYFGSSNEMQNYRFTSDGSIQVGPGDCATVPVPHAVGYGYGQIKNWITPVAAQLDQGAGEPFNETTVNCLIELIQKQIFMIENNMTISLQKTTESNELSREAKALLGVFSAMGGMIALVAIISCSPWAPLWSRLTGEPIDATDSLESVETSSSSEIIHDSAEINNDSEINIDSAEINLASTEMSHASEINHASNEVAHTEADHSFSRSSSPSRRM